MELDTCIKGRRSVRAYSDEPISKEHIEAVIEAGTWAPTGTNRQPWKFIVIENKELIKYISDETKLVVREIMPDMEKQFQTEADIICYNAPVLILICVEADNRWRHVNLLDSVLAAQNMFLKAYELGLGSCYMGFVGFLSTRVDVIEKIGVPVGYEIMVPLIIGHPKTTISQGKRNKPSVLKWIK
jgi:nitroreductase